MVTSSFVRGKMSTVVMGEPTVVFDFTQNAHLAVITLDTENMSTRLSAGPEEYVNEHTFRAIGYYLLVVIIAGAAGNSAVIYAFLNCKKLHTPTNLLIVNLSASDLVVALTGTPLSAYSTFNGRWMFGEIGCSFYGFINYYCGCISLNSLAAISIFRYYIVVKKLTGPKKITFRKSWHTVLIIHVYTLIFSTPPLFGWNRFILEGYRIGCDIDFRTKTPLYISYIGCMFIFLFFIPLGIIMFNYWRVFQAVRQHACTLANSPSARKPGLRKDSMLGFRSHFLRTRTGLILFITVAVFLVAWLPYCVVSLWVLLGDPSSISRVATVVPSLFAKSSVVYNPVIYVMLNPQYRKALMGSFHSSRPCTKITTAWQGTST
ncbi:rhodopsin, GQ-coupled-like [Diadema antillarum]|uniref:rhodopsin, GQ-coupled-like n=1 Tax=Diadema antillarum TaxID=105358 RepID=UPI003A873B0F